MKQAEAAEARRLRSSEGWSIKQIAGALQVSQSSVSRWVREIELSDSQRKAHDRAMAVARRRGNGRRSASARHARASAQEHGRRLARENELLHAMGCMLFWAEGSRSRNRVVFTNSDVEMVRLFLHFLRECYAVEDRRLALTINCFLGNGLTERQIEAWWLDRLGLSPTCLRKTIVNRPSRSSSGQHRVLPTGTARLVVHSTQIVQSMYGALQEYGQFERPDWLDLPTS